MGRFSQVALNLVRDSKRDFFKHQEHPKTNGFRQTCLDHSNCSGFLQKVANKLPRQFLWTSSGRELGFQRFLPGGDPWVQVKSSLDFSPFCFFWFWGEFYRVFLEFFGDF